MPKSTDQLLVFIMSGIGHVQPSLASESSPLEIAKKKKYFPGFYRLRKTQFTESL